MNIAPVLPESLGELPTGDCRASGRLLSATTITSRAQAQVQRAKLMMIDDEPINIRVIEKHLRGIGYSSFVSTTDPSQALDMLRGEQPDLLLLDLRMPHINGLELLRQIRAEDCWQSLPIAVLTAYSDPATCREALDAGCTDFLAKPVDPTELALRVRNMLVSKVLYDLVSNHASQLEAEVNRQAEALAGARHDAELRYHAGKAEIATEVLHNVGNALNSVNVGVNLVAYTVRDSKLLSLKRAVDLLKDHEDALPRFLTRDERGRLLPAYLIDVTESLLKERERIASELELVGRHLKHINAVVATQQKHAVQCQLNEDVSLAALLSDVDELLGGSFARHGVEVVRHYQDIPPLRTDSQKLLQVLLNVLKNAMDSIKQVHRTGMGRLEIRLGSRSPERAFIEVVDNGVGIPRGDLVKIFSHGFTTKRDGHGFGLHSCANLIRELGGSIQAHSDGPDTGATFVLDLPFRREEN